MDDKTFADALVIERKLFFDDSLLKTTIAWNELKLVEATSEYLKSIGYINIGKFNFSLSGRNHPLGLTFDISVKVEPKENENEINDIATSS